MSLPRQLEIYVTFAVQLECDLTIDETNRGSFLFAFQRYEVEDSLRIPIFVSHPKVVLVCQLDFAISTSLANWDRNPIEPFSLRLWADLIGSAIVSDSRRCRRSWWRVPVPLIYVRISRTIAEVAIARVGVNVVRRIPPHGIVGPVTANARTDKAISWKEAPVRESSQSITTKSWADKTPSDQTTAAALSYRWYYQKAAQEKKRYKSSHDTYPNWRQCCTGR